METTRPGGPLGFRAVGCSCHCGWHEMAKGNAGWGLRWRSEGREIRFKELRRPCGMVGSVLRLDSAHHLSAGGPGYLGQHATGWNLIRLLLPHFNTPKVVFSLRTTRPGSGSGLGERADGRRSGKTGETGSKNAIPDGIFFKARSDRSPWEAENRPFLPVSRRGWPGDAWHGYCIRSGE